MGDPILLCFSRRDVEAGNISPFLAHWGVKSLPKGKKLARMMGVFSFCIDGYNDDPEEIYSIQAARDFYAALHLHWPFWFYFCDLRNQSLRMITTCLLKNVEAQKIIGTPDAHLWLDPRELLGFISAGFPPMNQMCERANISEFDNWKRTKAIFAYFNLPFNVQPPA